MSDHGKTRIYSIVGIGPGTQLNGLFEIDAKIASGGMGEVFRGHEIMSGHPIAIKIVLSELAKDETIVGLFNKEARILRDFNHPAIVRYMAFGTDPVIGRPYLVMEFIDGPSLSERLESGPLELEEAKHLFGRLASGLDAAHQLGVVHRDISSDNIILANGLVSNAKIIDFGIARTTKGVTLLEGKFAGKYNFVSPEQLGLFNSVISEATDIYSLGLLMVNALRGVPIDMNGTQLEIIEKRRVVPDISDIDPSIRSIIESMLQPDPNDRKVTMADIAEWFTPVRERSKPPRPKPPTMVTVLPSDQVVASPDGEETAEEGARKVGRKGAEAAQKAASKTSLSKQVAIKPQDEDQAVLKRNGQAKADDGVADTQAASQSVDVIAKASDDLNKLASAASSTPAGSVTESKTGAGSGVPNPGNADDPTSGKPSSGISGPVSLPVFLPGGPQVTSPGVNASARRGAGGAKVAMAAGLAALVGLGLAFWFFGKSPTGDDNSAQVASAPKLTPSVTSADEPPKTQPVATPVEIKPVATPVETKPVADDPVLAAKQPDKAPDPVSNDSQTTREVSSTDERLSWVRAYQGGECFFARAVSVGEAKTSIEGIGANSEAFVRLEKDFKKRFGFEPQIEVRKIVNTQCGIATFLSGIAQETLPEMRMGLDNDKIKSNERLKGTLTGLSKPNVVLYLVDNEGTIHQFDRLLKRKGQEGSFGIKLVELKTRSPLPQLVLALSSDKPLMGAALRGPVKVDALMPLLESEIQKDANNFEYAFSYFLLGGK
jgi:serine/threonine protein kinase